MPSLKLIWNWRGSRSCRRRPTASATARCPGRVPNSGSQHERNGSVRLHRAHAKSCFAVARRTARLARIVQLLGHSAGERSSERLMTRLGSLHRGQDRGSRDRAVTRRRLRYRRCSLPMIRVRTRFRYATRRSAALSSVS
jgi:hypothetical protein